MPGCDSVFSEKEIKLTLARRRGKAKEKKGNPFEKFIPGEMACLFLISGIKYFSIAALFCHGTFVFIYVLIKNK